MWLIIPTMTHSSLRDRSCPAEGLPQVELVEPALAIVAVARLAAEPAAITRAVDTCRPFERQSVANAAVARLPAEPAAMTLKLFSSRLGTKDNPVVNSVASERHNLCVRAPCCVITPLGLRQSTISLGSAMWQCGRCCGCPATYPPNQLH